jgi:tetratricopeptide (TPR) repeat protein
MLRQASSLAEKGDFAAALRQVDRALKARPNDAAALMARGRILLMDGRAKEAEPSLRKVVESEPANSAARLMLGYSCLDQGRHAEAEALLRRVAEADGPIRLRVSAYLGLALAYDRMGRKDAVGRCYDEALALDESVADILLKVERQAFMPGPIPDSRDKPRLRGGLGQAEVNRIVKEVAREKP